MEIRKREIMEREECERRRYLSYYGIDILDWDIYDLIVDTTDLSPTQVSEQIIEGATHG